ncbi:hypothetical protein BJ912DRAFT_949473 [Pholiota molesta]|nr:hypothetical protein BJ912DRAFT_949473 [Pholiota molesta]
MDPEGGSSGDGDEVDFFLPSWAAMEALPVHRPGSLRSVASNSSLGSTVSLSRRPRTRARSRTVTGSPRPGDVPPSPLPSDLPYLGGAIVQEPLEVPDASPQRIDGSGEIRSRDIGSSQETSAADATFAEPTQSTAISSKLSPHLDTGYKPPPSAFSRDPALTPVVNVRDSVSTQQSGASSSLYPPSTSTASAPESPTYPQSMAEPEAPPFALEVNEVQEYDSDDVSYRLRLLVKNNYFLPPAHSKPSAADFAPPVDPQKKSPTPGFLDIFRVGKSKSKPTTPTGTCPGSNPMAPMLRTTADSITAPYTTRQQQPRIPGQSTHATPPTSAPPTRGRVVVVREKMQDIAVAAKQAEQDIKTRGVRIDHGSQKTAPAAGDDFIDPTDAVDLPLPSPSYPFAVQASALHGLGVLESLGADILADHLPPSENPNLSISYDPIEDSWRKAILKQAVHHSLDNTPDPSMFSQMVSSPVLSSQRPNTAQSSRIPTPNTAQKLINQKIISPLAMDDVARPSVTKHTRQKSAQSQASQASTSKKKAKPSAPTQNSSFESRISNYPRVETPLGPMTPLGPPPRRPFMNTAYSASQTEFSPSSSPNAHPANDSRPAIRRTMSSPSLAEGYDSQAFRRHPMTPPPLPNYPRDSQATFTTFTSFGTVRGNGNDDVYDMSSEPLESENEGEQAPSFKSALMSRLSLSEYSQASQSPTTSVFQETLNRGSHSSSASAEQRRDLISNPAVRAVSAMSPPPRESSSLAHYALPPPPRSSSLNYHASSMMPAGLSASHPNSRSYHTPQPDSENAGFEIYAPEPSSPPLPVSDRQDDPIHSREYSSLDLNDSIRSAPGPSSPTSFFDSIQAQPNAMDDLESSSDESENEEPLFSDPRSRAISSASDTNPRPPIMRLGNFSTPYIRGGETRQNTLPISNLPARPSKNDANPPSTSIFSSQATGSRDEESLRKLDGMLLQHMEDEKDTIRRIATTLKQTAKSQPSPHPDRR